MEVNRMKGIRRWRARRPSAGTVIGSLALMVALGGSAAANLPGKNSVNSGDIQNDRVKAADIRTDAVRLAELASDAVGSAELVPAAVRAADLGAIVERSVTVQVIDGSQNNATADCQPGEVVIGGGNDWSALNTGLRLQRSVRDGNGWNAAGANDSGLARDLTVYAYCLEV
jgi:hypothetical protein